MQKISENSLGRFATNAGGALGGTALGIFDDNDWVNQLKVYSNLTITHEVKFVLLLVTLSLYLDLLAERTGDLLSEEQLHFLRKEMQKGFVFLLNTVWATDKSNYDNLPGLLDDFSNMMKDKKSKSKMTTPQAYTWLLIEKCVKGVPEEMLIWYINFAIKLFEEKNLRNQLREI